MTLLDAVAAEVRRYLALPRHMLEAEPTGGGIQVRVSEYGWHRTKRVAHESLRSMEFVATCEADVFLALRDADFLIPCPRCGAHTEVEPDRPYNDVTPDTRVCTASACNFRTSP